MVLGPIQALLILLSDNNALLLHVLRALTWQNAIGLDVHASIL
jgi:hypothetical protein